MPLAFPISSILFIREHHHIHVMPKTHTHTHTTPILHASPLPPQHVPGEPHRLPQRWPQRGDVFPDMRREGQRHQPPDRLRPGDQVPELLHLADNPLVLGLLDQPPVQGGPEQYVDG
ncbi:hypothetical protein Vafri_20182, partial [Volvox africanus]